MIFSIIDFGPTNLHLDTCYWTIFHLDLSSTWSTSNQRKFLPLLVLSIYHLLSLLSETMPHVGAKWASLIHILGIFSPLSL